MITILLGAAVAVVMALFVDWQEGKEFKAKHGFSRRDFRQYRKMMKDSSFRAKQRKSPAFTELTRRPINLN